jgi:hypothetical protein
VESHVFRPDTEVLFLTNMSLTLVFVQGSEVSFGPLLTNLCYKAPVKSSLVNGNLENFCEQNVLNNRRRRGQVRLLVRRLVANLL